MSDITTIAIILAPLLLLCLFFTITAKKNLPEANETSSTIIGSLFYIGNLFGGIIAVLLFFNNLFGAVLLMVGGLLIIWQKKLFNDVNWVGGNAAISFGMIWLLSGALIAWSKIN